MAAAKKALQRANLTLQDVELTEVNKAFAGQYRACEKWSGPATSGEKPEKDSMNIPSEERSEG